MTNRNGTATLSAVLPTGEILETVYDSTNQETFLAIGIDGEARIDNDYTDSRGDKWLPYPADDLITKGFVKLPSKPDGHETPEKLYQEIRDLIAEFVQLPSDFLSVASVYVMMTWLYDRFETLPYLRILGDFGTGKSRFQQVMGNLCYKAVLASSMSVASIFRVVDQTKGTLLLDEADFRSTEFWSEITKILNAGHTKGFPVVRMNANKKDGSMTIQAFEVFGPKVLCSRERFGDEALESRCLAEHILPQESSRAVHLPSEFNQKSLAIRNKLLGFRFQYFHTTSVDESTIQSISFPRLRQTALAITSLASDIGEEVLGQVLSFLKRYEDELKTSRKHDVKADVLLCLLDLQEERKDELMPKLYMKQIADKFNEKFYEDYSDEDRWKETKQGVFREKQKIVSPRRIGTLVKKLAIRTERDEYGFFIPLNQEKEKIQLLRERYGFKNPQVKKEEGSDEILF
jgi:hypothetical protein